MMKSLLILGHGQLGLMMAAEAAQLGLKVDRLDMQTGELLLGTSSQRQTVEPQWLLDTYDVITAEIEHLPHSELLDKIYASEKWANRLAFELLPNRYSQKTLLDSLAVPTAPWLMLEQETDIDEALLRFGDALIVKSTTGGYDGKGQWRINAGNRHELPPAMYGSLIAEQKIPFEREVSIVGARDRSGRCYFFPITENIHYDGILRYSLANIAVDQLLHDQAACALQRILDHLDFVGVMAMECFVTDQHLLVNELAPRVHNSGHWTQLGALHNQFALQILPLLSLPVPVEQPCQPTIMLNLIGCPFESRCIGLPHISYHWYGKELRAGRKLGHINIDASNAEKLNQAVAVLLPLLDKEHQSLLIEAQALYTSRSSIK